MLMKKLMVGVSLMVLPDGTLVTREGVEIAATDAGESSDVSA